MPVDGRTVIVVDDGIATGATAAAACQVVREMGAARVVLAVPVAPPDAVAWLRTVADEVVCLSTPRGFSAVGEWYQDFSQTPDEEVVSLLARAADRSAPREAEVVVDADGVALAGDLVLPPDAGAVVVFAHGSGSSRHSPRNRSVAEALRQAGLGTLLFDLLTPQEEADRANVFDIETLARRLTETTAWLRRREHALPIGYFGASTGAAAALWAASARSRRRRGRGHQPGRGRRGLPRRPSGPRRATAHAAYGRRPSSSWAAATRRCSTSTGRPRLSCAARTAWRSSPAPHTSSRSRERWTRWRASPATGSRRT